MIKRLYPAVKALQAFLSRAHTYPRVVALRCLGAHVGRRARFYNNYTTLPLSGAETVWIGDDVQISKWATITVRGGRFYVGDGASIGRFNAIFCGVEIDIGDGCLLSDWVKISDGRHVLKPGGTAVDSGIEPVAPIKIGANTFIGHGAVIEPGVVIGARCVVGAYAVLTKGSFFPDGSVIVGAPARALPCGAQS